MSLALVQISDAPAKFKISKWSLRNCPYKYLLDLRLAGDEISIGTNLYLYQPINQDFPHRLSDFNVIPFHIIWRYTTHVLDIWGCQLLLKENKNVTFTFTQICNHWQRNIPQSSCRTCICLQHIPQLPIGFQGLHDQC